MGLFFKKSATALYAPATGQLKSIAAVKDTVFSSQALGDGYAVEPSDGAIYAPIEGTVTSVFPTKHAIGLKTKQGIEVLLHLGIDTVELNGNGFTMHVSEGSQVTPTTKLVDMDLNYLADQKKVTDVIVIFTNLNKQKLSYTTGAAQAGAEVGHLA
ncbi:PTS sugar transporter subunit IIA [Lactiplantibacillus daowaiensis]|uniref:PTS glucose transporter subunit IIA n=1 Tax=Lactiplantibacillus daowaiensis TaxID=2559918 RepID=A0ABW1S237_9LACO|nr:PTS glucose transporter subunit IIA [Lactiplantibacillus daowaiensis]